jgi:hypothetical protein
MGFFGNLFSFRVYRPYVTQEDLDIWNVTNRYIAAEFLATDSTGREVSLDELYGLRVTTNQFLGGWPPPPIVFDYRHYRRGTNEMLRLDWRDGHRTLKKVSNYPGRPVGPMEMVAPKVEAEEGVRLDRLYQHLKEEIRKQKP